MRHSMRAVRLFALAAVIAIGAGTGAATANDSGQACCYPGAVLYYDAAGELVGVRQFGCGDPGWGITTTRSRAVNGCVM